MKTLNKNASNHGGFQTHRLTVAVLTTLGTMLMTSSISQATDLQIYAKPTSGQKTITLMLDTSGSMDYGSIAVDYTGTSSDTFTNTGGNGSYTYTRYYKTVAYNSAANSAYQKQKNKCYNPNLQADGTESGTAALQCYARISRLQDGLFALLDNDTDPNLPSTAIAIGNYSAGGDGKSGQILIEATKLGSKGSTQRNALKAVVAGLTARNGTPSANAYAEAAAYMLGTNTVQVSDVAVDKYKAHTADQQVLDRYECNNTAYSNLNPDDNKCYKYSGFSGNTANPTTINDYSCNNPSYPYKNGTTCYQYDRYSGGNTNQVVGSYSCPPDGAPTYTQLGTSNATNKMRCYLPGKVNSNNPSSNYRNANANMVCPSGYPYFNTVNNKCYSGNGYGGGTQAATATFNRYECQNSSYPWLNAGDNKCYQKNTGYGGGLINPTAVYKTVAVTTYYQCRSWMNVDFDNLVQYCGSGSTNYRTSTSSSYWTNLGTTPPSGLNSDYTVDSSSSNPIFYTQQETRTGSSTYSGFSKSVDGAKIADKTKYASPLPAADKRASCDGNGIYFLSDGEANSTSVAIAQPLARAALNDNSFTCPTTDGLTDLNGDSAWNCMGELAKRLFSGNNPQNAQIRTAFVGFGKDFAGLNKAHVQQACKLASRTQADRKGDDACSPNQTTTHKVTAPGYGNGLYYEAASASDVTESVSEFIRTFDNVLEPIPTGAISIPVDALNPNGFQPYGYLRMFAATPGSNTQVWLGNLKKYNVLVSGANAGALGDRSNALVFGNTGDFVTTTSDKWNDTGVADGGLIDQGGMYWNLPMPTQAVAAVAAVGQKRAIPAILTNPNGLRNLFTDVASVDSSGVLQTLSSGNSLLMIPERTSASVTTDGAYVLDRFSNQNVLKAFSVDIKVKLLNYLGYDLPLSTTTSLPTTLTTPPSPFITLGGSVHSYPVQLTYSGDLDANGDLTTVRTQSVLFGTMEGAIHVLDSNTGAEQMAFVPATILNDVNASKALRGRDQAGDISHGMDGNWVVDPAYSYSTGSGGVSSKVQAKQMNVYGGMRMGGKGYYGLNLLNPTSPKLLFSIQGGTGDYTRMGQTWSKPIITNIRYNGKITRVMIVGGGYDMCYENPQFKLSASNSSTDYPDTSCDNKAQADGNAVYIIDAKTGARLWWSSNTGSNSNNTDMKHSIVSRISTLDRDGDGLVDHLYFGDLGGQVFRVDLNNKSNTGASDFGKRVVRLANLGTTAAGVQITNGNQPRFYQPPTVTIHDAGANTFILVGIASGDRSTPLDVIPVQGREGMLPASALTNRLDNNVYGIIDRDFIKKNLITGSPTLVSQDINLSTMVNKPQTITGNVVNTFFPTTGTGKNGWYRSLRSDYTGVDNTNREAGGLKAFEEEPIALKDNLFVPVYDPQGTGVDAKDSCSTRIVGESDRQQFCLPFGACINTDGTLNIAAEKKTGFILDANKKNTGVIGSGIRGITLGPREPSSGAASANSCGSLTLVGNTQGAGEWSCTRMLNPVRWYEKYIGNN